MENSKLDLPGTVLEAFTHFYGNKSLLALPLALHNGSLEPLLPVRSSTSFQTALNELSTVLNPRTPLYILLRRKDILVAITFVPYLAKDVQRAFFLEHRQELVQKLGKEHFSQSLICKEIGEITDARSWNERDEDIAVHKSASDLPTYTEGSQDDECEACAVQDLGYKRNKCRLCDRRMQNKISPEALAALDTLAAPSALVQISINPTTSSLVLVLSSHSDSPDSVASLIPANTPTFTFYHHPANALVYFIFHSPDSATVQQRMTHTVAIPGLLVHAEDAGVHVDAKVEIHEPGELVFEESDARKGRFRSLWERDGFRGTEGVYTGMAGDTAFLENLE